MAADGGSDVPAGEHSERPKRKRRRGRRKKKEKKEEEHETTDETQARDVVMALHAYDAVIFSRPGGADPSSGDNGTKMKFGDEELAKATLIIRVFAQANPGLVESALEEFSVTSGIPRRPEDNLSVAFVRAGAYYALGNAIAAAGCRGG